MDTEEILDTVWTLVFRPDVDDAAFIVGSVKEFLTEVQYEPKD